MDNLSLSPQGTSTALAEWPSSSTSTGDGLPQRVEDCFSTQAIGIHQCFEVQVEKTPDAIALRWDGHPIPSQPLTYQQLNQQANQLARYLQTQGIGPEVLVGICIERSPAMIVGLLAILKAGGGYVPLAPDLPKERLNFVLDETGIDVVLTQKALRGCFTDHAVQTVCLDQPGNRIEQFSTKNLNQGVDPESVMYVIYTSGSTGTPKGVMIPHRGIRNQLQWRQLTFPLASGDRVLQNISFTFDPSVWQIFWPLTCGAQVVLPKPGGQKDIHYLMELIAQQQISVIALVPSLLEILLRQPGLERLATLKHVFCGGEALPGELQSLFFQQLADLTNPPQLHNVYGPTEASIDASYWTCERDRIEPVAPIGRPMLNATLHVLNDQRQELLDGEIGELYIGGPGLALGYLNRPELTESRFITHSFVAQPPQRLYKTGDLVRWLPDGLLAFVGRVDSQVKIRGFRIELGEIESILRQHPLVTNAAVIVQDEGAEKRLIAYVTSDKPMASDTDGPSGAMEAKRLPASELRDFVRDKLPDYMVPTQCIWLEQFPLNPNGKIDRRALQKLDVALPSQSTKTLPSNELEACLVNIWSDVLGHPVGVDDNFFDVGGQSLLAIELCRLMGEALGQTLVPAQLFSAPTIASFCQQLQDSEVNQIPSLSLSRPEGTKTPFFFINSQGSLQQLLPHLEPDQPVYGLNIFGLTQRYHGDLDALTVEAIATDMIADILTIQPKGPYQLLTYCGDSRLTLEIAQQMRQQGHDIGLLLFIDAIWDEKTPDLAAHWQNVRRLGVGYIWTKLWRIVSGQRDRMKQRYVAIQRRHQHTETKKDQDGDFLQHFIHLSRQYQGEPYPGKIVLLLSSEWVTLNTPKLAEMAQGGLEVHEVEGYHHTLFDASYVQTLAQTITTCLATAAKSSGE